MLILWPLELNVVSKEEALSILEDIKEVSGIIQFYRNGIRFMVTFYKGKVWISIPTYQNLKKIYQ